MKKSLPAPLLRKYLSGQSTPDEEALVEDWYASFDNQQDYTASLTAGEKQLLRERMLSRLPRRSVRNRRIGWFATGVAASLIAGIYFFSPSGNKPAVTADPVITLFNKTAAISENKLSDGSEVWLMPGARLSYRQRFTGRQRPVWLDGEAFFEVTKNPAKPFIISSNHLITTVWGTSFRVRDGRLTRFADVTVLTGKVSVKVLHSPKKEVMIYPAQQVSYLKQKNALSEQPKADMTEMALWKKPDASFNNRPLKEVIPVLEDSFKVSITPNQEKINSLLLTADFNGLNFAEIMQILHKVLDIDYTINGQNVRLTTNTNP